ncbi:MAG: hypothetical protein HY565_05395 [Candidatus Kerfeldbacteria bacterium]|nr:hypothetical protein [Candidatus Kerfeldbacteria bacterium]
MSKSILTFAIMCACVAAYAAYGQGQGSDWEWNENPIPYIAADEMVVCVQIADRTGPIVIDVQTAGETRPELFQPSSLGQCIVLPSSSADTLTLLPQHQFLFLQSAHITRGDETTELSPVVGGWRLH